MIDKPILTVSDLVSLGVEEQHAKDWIIARGRKKLTQSALKMVISEARKLGWSLPMAVKFSAEHGYIGFKASWVVKDVGFIEKHTNMDWREGLN